MPEEILGQFDGERFYSHDGYSYPVPNNYISKSKLVVGDQLKLTITDSGDLMYKQIKPVERKNLFGMFVRDDVFGLVVEAAGRRYRLNSASVHFFKPVLGEKALIVIPKYNIEVKWAALEDMIRQGPTATGFNMKEIQSGIKE